MAQYVGAMDQAALENMDEASIAAAAQQLEAIQAALQQAGNGVLSNPDQLAVLEQLGHAQGKPEDFYAHLVGVVGAVAGDGHGEGQEGDGAEASGPMTDKPLTSRFRGVCWNKKNRRWQAAINSSGKYIYLGSFVKEEEAARAFDKAALRLRGNRAKLNYVLQDYVDERGCLIDDPRLTAHLQNVLGKDAAKMVVGGGGHAKHHDHSHHNHGGGGAHHTAGAAAAASSSAANVDMLQQLAAASLQQQQQQALVTVVQPHLVAQHKSPHYPYTPWQKHMYGALEVPEGCLLVAHIPGDDEAFAVLYMGPTIPRGGAGAAVWDGTGAIDLGVFDTDKDARQAAGAVLKLAMFQRQTLLSAITTGTGGPGLDTHTTTTPGAYGVMLGGPGSADIMLGRAGGALHAELAAQHARLQHHQHQQQQPDAAALAAAAAMAAATAGGDAGGAGMAAHHHHHHHHQQQYKDLFNFMAVAHNQPQAVPQLQQVAAVEESVGVAVDMGAHVAGMLGTNGMSATAFSAVVAEFQAQQQAAQQQAAQQQAAQQQAAQQQAAQQQAAAAVGNSELVGGVGMPRTSVREEPCVDEEGHAAKRRRADGGLQQMKQLSTFKLQDVMKAMAAQAGGGLQ